MKTKVNDLMAFTYWAKVKRLVGSHNLDVVNVDNGDPFSVNGASLIDAATSADYFEFEEKITRTEMAEKLIGAKNIPFTVCFDKQDGDERVLRGRLISHEALLGRSSVEDLDLEGKNRLRLVDHRTLKWLILNKIKYKVK